MFGIYVFMINSVGFYGTMAIQQMLICLYWTTVSTSSNQVQHYLVHFLLDVKKGKWK